MANIIAYSAINARQIKHVADHAMCLWRLAFRKHRKKTVMVESTRWHEGLLVMLSAGHADCWTCWFHIMLIMLIPHHANHAYSISCTSRWFHIMLVMLIPHHADHADGWSCLPGVLMKQRSRSSAKVVERVIFMSAKSNEESLQSVVQRW